MGTILTNKQQHIRVEHEEISDLSKSNISPTSSDVTVINLYNECRDIISKYNLSIDMYHTQIILRYEGKSIGSFSSISNLYYFIKGYQIGILHQSQ
jgi:hypothetical protein